MKITSTAGKIKLYIDCENDRVNMYRLLDNIAYELRDVRNDTIRGCIAKYEMNQKQIDVPVERTNGKKHTYNTFNTLYRRELKYATKTLASWAACQVENKFRNEIKDYLRGKRSIPGFKDQNIIIKKCGTEIGHDGDYYYRPAILSGMGFAFRFVNIEKDKSVRAIVDRIISGDYSLCDHFIKRVGKFWYLYIVYSFEGDALCYDEDTCVGVDVGYAIPAVCALNNSSKRLYCGDGMEIHRFKTQIKLRKKRLQASGGKTGHGKTRLMKSYKNLADYEANFIKSYNHKISKMVVDFAVKNNAGKIIMEDLHSGVKKENKILLRNWSYYQLQQMIEYKAKSKGIKVNKIPPQYTSQTCSVCGYTDRKNRKSQSEFVCLNEDCKNKDSKTGRNKVVNADYNAAKNIANGGLNCTPVSNEAVLTA